MEELPDLLGPTILRRGGHGREAAISLQMNITRILSMSRVSTRSMQWQDMPPKANLGSRDLLLGSKGVVCYSIVRESGWSHSVKENII